MTDNRTTELLPCPFCGGEAEVIEADYGMFPTGYAVYCRTCCTKIGVTGRLGESYEWTPIYDIESEAVGAWNARAERGTLTADDIRDLIERHSDESGGNGRDFHNGAYVAIADELNARAERTCEFKPFRGPISDTDEEGERQGICSVCSAYMHEQFCFCPNCGAKVVNA